MLTFHPLANAFPLLEGTQFASLIQDIASNGICEPIWLYEGEVLDGRNRYRACQVLDLDCPTREYEGSNPVGFVISMNLTRRHLDESQRGMVANRLAVLRDGRPQKTSTITEVSRVQAATLLNVHPDTVSRAHKIQEQGIPELTQAVDAGEITISAALPFTTLPREEQPAAMEDARVQARGRKVTAAITKEVVKKKDVLTTLRSALDEGVDPSTALKQTLQTHAIAIPTPGLADAMAREMPQPVAIPATDGYYHDGRTPLEAQDRKDYVQRIFQLFNALQALATLPDPADMLEEIPDYSAHRVSEHLEPALLWLSTFAALWRHDHADVTGSLA